ncbi:TIR domain-containing protein [Polychytrium aggregatum]|uniref:TIR domain-containing protein n=1 Tax=Polychytrium aggregatum TaxID=110093 RepID=UPI0022FE5442|nr:TIR domain-containing protein [Polychytrium aggregatum]KAI9208490.1 TIR domain-containing protein [Polychytrium aggregatum]
MSVAGDKTGLPAGVVLVPGPTPTVLAPSTFDLMLSYQWSHQETVKKIRDSLKARGLSVWMDLDCMAGNINDAMYDGVVSSRVIVPCLTAAYEASYNCKKELNFADAEKKPLVPVRLDRGPFTWSAIITSGLLYVDLCHPNGSDSEAAPMLDTDSAWWNSKMDMLAREIRAKQNSKPIAQRSAQYRWKWAMITSGSLIVLVAIVYVIIAAVEGRFNGLFGNNTPNFSFSVSTPQWVAANGLSCDKACSKANLTFYSTSTTASTAYAVCQNLQDTDPTIAISWSEIQVAGNSTLCGSSSSASYECLCVDPKFSASVSTVSSVIGNTCDDACSFSPPNTATVPHPADSSWVFPVKALFNSHFPQYYGCKTLTGSQAGTVLTGVCQTKVLDSSGRYVSANSTDPFGRSISFQCICAVPPGSQPTHSS